MLLAPVIIFAIVNVLSAFHVTTSFAIAVTCNPFEIHLPACNLKLDSTEEFRELLRKLWFLMSFLVCRFTVDWSA